jgi:CelD/BcsL family acetyltransferase involved in cellulose biosynthesis
MLSKSHRKQIRRLERKYFESGRARLRLVETQAELSAAMDTLVRLHQRRRHSVGEHGCFASPRFAAFHREAAAQLLDAGCLRLATLAVDEQTIAAEYQVLGDGVVYAYQSGIEPAALAMEPGRLITLATLRRAIAERRRAFDFLRGDEVYKAHWRAQPRSSQDIRVVADTPGARLRHRLRWATRGVKHWLKHRLAADAARAR